ncbi:MAG: thiamine phosphate synthase [Bacillota bacterium]
MSQVLGTDLYCITAEEYSGGRSNVQVVKEMLAAGIEVIQYREKNKSMRDKYAECMKIRELTAETGTKLIVNDHIDLALAVEADGVHLGQEDMPPAVARELAGDEMIIGQSTHSPRQARKAVEAGVDYIGVGPLFPTSTKEGVCDAVGLEYLDYVVEELDISFVAIGGIKEYNISRVKKRGAECICLVTGIVGADDIERKINDLRNEIKACE